MKVFSVIIFIVCFQYSLQDCPEEVSRNGLTVTWKQTSDAVDLTSEPVCYYKQDILKRNCTDNTWIPRLNELSPCEKVIDSFNVTVCPPGFHKISTKNNDYCYEISSPSTWDYPCFTSGVAFIITDLDNEEFNLLIDSVVATNISRYFWLPAKRQKLFNPVVWTIPGPNWGQGIVNKELKFNNLFWKNCLALDVWQRQLVTESCSENHPSLCFYLNSYNHPATCPPNYYVFRYGSGIGKCYGIEYADDGHEWSFNTFINKKCENPIYDDGQFKRYAFNKLAERNNLPDHFWCWIKSTKHFYDNSLSMIDNETLLELEGIIDKTGTLGLANASTLFPCMACEKEIILGATNLMFEYNEILNKIFLTVYFPSGLWKYNDEDKGVRCFSDAKGFGKAIDINDLPHLLVKSNEIEGFNEIEKIVYEIDLVTDRSAQYWCEGHTFNFSLITTEKIIINPNAKEMHVFSLTLNYHNITNTLDLPDTTNLIKQLTVSLDAQKILLMDIYNVTSNFITVLLHVHVSILENHSDTALNILETFNDLKNRCEYFLPIYNCTFLNLTSSIYCLPGTTNDQIYLQWPLTHVGQISAPSQFCLQANGLPVTRKCLGTYLTGGIWGPVEGRCDNNYIPTNITTLLYDILKGYTPNHYITNFMTVTLNMILNDVESIIPADIYYLSISLNRFLTLAQENVTSVEMGDINNIAWVMDRVMDLDCDYLRLSQTLNSTNVIINSLDNLVEMIATRNTKETITTLEESKNRQSNVAKNEPYQLAVKSQFIIQISYPKVNNVTGLAFSMLSENGTFNDIIIHPLYSNTSVEDVLSIDKLEIATWLPMKLYNTLKKCNNETISPKDDDNLHIIISVYKNDAVFPELVNSDHIINSRIIGVSIPNYETNLQYPLPIVFKQLHNNGTDKSCGFWDFQSKTTSQFSRWKIDGCFPHGTRNPDIVVCKCYHLTHFSQLINLPTVKTITDPYTFVKHTKVLNVITLTGCFLSITGVIGIWITACVFSNWRKKAGTKVLLQLSASVALPLVLIVISNLDTSMFVLQDDVYVMVEHMKPLCITIGAMLHYSILASFMWMLITAVLQFIRYVRVLGVKRPSRFLFKFGLIGWGIPLIPVIIVLSIDAESYIPASSISKSICYPKGSYFIVSVMVPICIILLINVILFISVLHSISRGPNEGMKSSDMDLVGAQLRLSVFLFFLLGLTWIFGIFSFSRSLIWSYLFCLTATLQGFVLFIYFIICDPATRNMWITLVKPPLSATTSRNSITSFSN